MQGPKYTQMLQLLATLQNRIKLDCNSLLISTDVHKKDSRSQARRTGCCFWDSLRDWDTAFGNTSSAVLRPASPVIHTD